MKKAATPTLTDIEAFVTIAKEGGLTAAGQKLNQKPSTLSMAMQRIAAVIGGEPFMRVKGGLELSRLGHDFLNDALNMLNLWHQMRDRLEGRKHEMAGSFRLCCIPEAGVIVLPAVFRFLEKNFPKIILSVVSPELGTISETVTRGAADFGLTVEKQASQILVQKTVFHTAISVWQHKQAKSVPDKLFVNPAFNDFEDIRKRLSRKFSGDIVRIDSLNLVAEFAEHGCGYGLLPDIVAKRRGNLVQTRQHRHIGEISKINLIYRPELRDVTASRAIIDAFQSVAGAKV